MTSVPRSPAVGLGVLILVAGLAGCLTAADAPFDSFAAAAAADGPVLEPAQSGTEYRLKVLEPAPADNEPGSMRVTVLFFLNQPLAPVKDARVSVNAFGPDGATAVASTEHTAHGLYVGSITLSEGGAWRFDIDATPGNLESALRFTFDFSVTGGVEEPEPPQTETPPSGDTGSGPVTEPDAGTEPENETEEPEPQPEAPVGVTEPQAGNFSGGSVIATGSTQTVPTTQSPDQLHVNGTGSTVRANLTFLPRVLQTDLPASVYETLTFRILGPDEAEMNSTSLAEPLVIIWATDSPAVLELEVVDAPVGTYRFEVSHRGALTNYLVQWEIVP